MLRMLNKYQPTKKRRALKYKKKQKKKTNQKITLKRNQSKSWQRRKNTTTTTEIMLFLVLLFFFCFLSYVPNVHVAHFLHSFAFGLKCELKKLIASIVKNFSRIQHENAKRVFSTIHLYIRRTKENNQKKREEENTTTHRHSEHHTELQNHDTDKK